MSDPEGVNTVYKNPTLYINLREQYAGLAMQGYRSNQYFSNLDSGQVARSSVEDADALIVALQKEKS